MCANNPALFFNNPTLLRNKVGLLQNKGKFHNVDDETNEKDFVKFKASHA